MRKCYIAPDAYLLKFQAKEALAKDDIILDSAGFDTEVGFDDLFPTE